jgi:putative ABC transport system substrate-binding protein
MRRREFITALGGAAAWPMVTRAQQTARTARLGLLVGMPANDPGGIGWIEAFLGTLHDLGWKRDVNLQIDIRWTGVDPDAISKAAQDIVSPRPDVIHVITTPATAAVLRESRSIPVVFSIVSDPLGSGFVQSFARPGGNATGFVNIEASLGSKWLNLLKEIAPATRRASILFNPKTAPQSDYYLSSLQSAAPALGLAVKATAVDSAREIETVITDLATHRDAGLVVIPDLFIAAQAQQDLTIELAARHRIPAVYPFAFFVRSGGLLSYGIDLDDLERRAAGYVDRILKGAKAHELPVQLPTKFELAINLKTAKALGIELPPTLLALADEAIE